MGMQSWGRAKQTHPGCVGRKEVWSGVPGPGSAAPESIRAGSLSLMMGSQGFIPEIPSMFFTGSLLETDTTLHSGGLHGILLGKQLPASCWWNNLCVSGCPSQPNSQTSPTSSPSHPCMCHWSRLRWALGVGSAVWEEPVCSLTSSWLEKSTESVLGTGTVPHSRSQTSLPLPASGRGWSRFFRAGWCQHLQTSVSSWSWSWLGREALSAGCEGQVGCGGCGCWGQMPTQDEPSWECSCPAAPNLQPAPHSSSSSPGTAPLLLSFLCLV